MSKSCSSCQGINHTAFNCPSKPRKPLHTKKRLNPIGKIGRALAKQSRQFKRETPTNHEGYYECYLCGRWITPEETRPEHVKSRSHHPEHRFNKENLKPACDPCNEAKGSMDVDNYLEKVNLERQK